MSATKMYRYYIFHRFLDYHILLRNVSCAHLINLIKNEEKPKVDITEPSLNKVPLIKGIYNIFRESSESCKSHGWSPSKWLATTARCWLGAFAFLWDDRFKLKGEGNLDKENYNAAIITHPQSKSCDPTAAKSLSCRLSSDDSWVICIPPRHQKTYQENFTVFKFWLMSSLCSVNYIEVLRPHPHGLEQLKISAGYCRFAWVVVSLGLEAWSKLKRENFYSLGKIVGPFQCIGLYAIRQLSWNALIETPYESITGILLFLIKCLSRSFSTK